MISQEIMDRTENYASDYCEPGYSLAEGKQGIVFANWNNFTKEEIDEVEETHEIEWSDEWAICDDCDKAIRTSPDSHGWTRHYHLMNDCEIVCLDCVKDDPFEYFEDCMNDFRKSVNSDFAEALAESGFTKDERNFESGLHPGQTDSPETIAKGIKANGKDDFVFVIDSVGQFDIQFSLWTRSKDFEGE